MQAAQTRQFHVVYQYWTDYSQSYTLDSIVVQADSQAHARRVAQDEYNVLEIVLVKELPAGVLQ